MKHPKVPSLKPGAKVPAKGGHHQGMAKSVGKHSPKSIAGPTAQKTKTRKF